jgi:hypothetical protein
LSIQPEHRRAIRIETAISTAINSLVPAAIIWFVQLPPPDSLVGVNGIVGPMTKASGLATFLMTLVLTTIVRMRVRKGGLPKLIWPRAERGVLRWLPDSLLLRAIVMGLLAVVLTVPAGLAIVALVGVIPLDRVGFLIFNLLFGAAVGIVMTRFVMLPALADPGRA